MSHRKSDLGGQTVLVTRPQPVGGGKDALSDLLTENGARVVNFPVIRLQLPENLSFVEKAIAEIAGFGSLVFLSANGVCFFDRLRRDLDIQCDSIAAAVDIVAIGRGTQAAASRIGFSDVKVPEESADSSLLAMWLSKNCNEPYLILRADRGSQVLAQDLSEFDKQFQELTIYESVDVEIVDAEIADQMSAGKINWVTLTSSAIASSTIRLFRENLKRTKLATLGPQISEVVRAYGYDVDVESNEADFAALVKAIAAADGG